MEAVLACSLLAILLVAGRSAVVLAARATRGPALDDAMMLASAMSDLSSDALCSTQSPTVTANSITLVVPDRNGDGEDEQITYSWSGTPGAPLQRSVNGAAPSTLLTAIKSFTVATSSASISVPGTPTKSTERLVGGNSTSSGLYSTTISSTSSRAASFIPSLPSTSTSWTLTRVRLMVRQSSTVSGSFNVQIQTTNAQSPTGVALATATIAEFDLSASFGWKDISFSGLTNLSTVAPLAVVVTRAGAAANPCDLQHTSSGGAQVAGNALYSSSNGGTSWSNVSGDDMIYAVYGIPDTPTAQVSTTGLKTLRISAETTSGAVQQISVPTLNTPQL